MVGKLADDIRADLAEAENDRALTKGIARYGRVDLLCLDLCRTGDYADAWRGRRCLA